MATSKKIEFTQEQRDAYCLSFVQAKLTFEKHGLTLDETTCGKFSRIQNLYASHFSRGEISREKMIDDINEVLTGKKRTVDQKDIV